MGSRFCFRDLCRVEQLSVRELWGFQVGQGDAGLEENIITSKPNAGLRMPWERSDTWE